MYKDLKTDKTLNCTNVIRKTARTNTSLIRHFSALTSVDDVGYSLCSVALVVANVLAVISLQV